MVSAAATTVVGEEGEGEGGEGGELSISRGGGDSDSEGSIGGFREWDREEGGG